MDDRPQSKVHAWDRWLPAWHGLYYLLLAISTILALRDPEAADQQLVVVIGAIILASWYGIFVRYHPDHWLQRPFALAAAIALQWIIWFLLTLSSTAFMIMLFSMYAQVFLFVSYPLAFVVAGLLTVVGWIQNLVVSGQIPFEVVLFGIASTVAGSVIAVFMNETIKQSGERHELLEAVKIAQAKQAQAEREAGILQERQRMAQEIHDTLAQGFTSIVMHLEAAERALPNDPDKTNHHIIQARQMSRSSLEEARRLVWALRPEILESNSLAESLREVVMNWSEANHIPAHFAVNGGTQPQLPAPIETTLLRVAQEALANIMKHAQAQQVNVTLSLLDDQVILDVLDDGIGFDVGHVRPNATKKSGLGLMGMRERIEKLGGSLLIESNPDEGAAIVAAVPLQSDIHKERV